MLKLTTLAIGLLTVISMAPSAQAYPVQGSTSDIHRQGDLHPQIILNVNPEHRNVNPEYRREQEYHQRREADRRRQIELEREREFQARLAAERRRREYAQHRHNSHSDYRENRDYRGEYRRDR
jgi:hypothetical protein